MKESMKFHENFENLHINTLEDHSYFIPFKNGENPYEVRENSSEFELLNGEWEFKYFSSFYDIDDDDILYDGYEDTMHVPSCIQLNGCDYNQYVNIKYPIPYNPPFVPYDNPVIMYKRHYEYNNDGNDRILVFEGVDSCFYLLINNKLFGYSQVSHATSEFNITNALEEGDNEIKVIVLKWSDGTYLEDQDKWRFTGIIRDVYMLSRPKERVSDYRISTSFGDEYRKAMLHIDLKTNTRTKISLYSHTGILLHEGTVECDSYIDITVENPYMWTAETPTLYNLTFETADEIIGEKVGLREITVEDAVVKLNGNIVKLKGVNRHEMYPDTGAVVTREKVINDLLILKSFNINAIRTAHYPNVPYFYQLCDELGFYVIDEADIEAHAQLELYTELKNAKKSVELPFAMDDENYKKAILDRVNKMVLRDYNRPCIIFWSLGNESGFGANFKEAAEYVKSIDMTRLVHYESTDINIDNSGTDALDMISRMYPSVIELHKKEVKESDKPYFLCEYSHSMGNSCGDLEDYWNAIYSNEKIVGACAWEMADQGIYIGSKNDKPMYAFGGDFGESLHDGNFCIDGLMSPDRTPHSNMYELKNVYRPVRVYPEDISKGIYGFYNTMNFVNVKDLYRIYFEVTDNGAVVSEGEISIDLEPLTYVAFHIPKLTAISGQDLRVRFITKLKANTPWMPVNDEVGFDQIVLGAVNRKFRPDKSKGKKTLDAKSGKKDIVIYAGDIEYVLSKKSGMLSSMKKDGEELFKIPAKLNIFRAPLDNDIKDKEEWFKYGFNDLTYKVTEQSIVDNGEEITIKLNISLIGPLVKIADVETIYKFYPNGEMNISLTAKIAECISSIPRFGMRFFFTKDFDDLSYYGYGPFGSYIDKHQASYIASFDSSVAKEHEDFINPQENASHYGTQEVLLSNGKTNINVLSDEDFSFSTSHYLLETLTGITHNYMLEEDDLTELCIDGFMSGVGSASCGPELKDEYKIVDKELFFNFWMQTNI